MRGGLTISVRPMSYAERDSAAGSKTRLLRSASSILTPTKPRWSITTTRKAKDDSIHKARRRWASDARHKNVPDGLAPIPPLLGHVTSFAADPGADALNKQRKFATVAQVARWRGWSEVFFTGSYGTMLKTAEKYLNNIVKKGEIGPLWKARPSDALPGAAKGGGELTELLMQDPKKFGALSGAPISASDLKLIAQCWYPVHAMGYNFIKSNSDSARVIAKRIRGLIKGYQKRGLKCDEVIIVTHSMGGLLARDNPPSVRQSSQ